MPTNPPDPTQFAPRRVPVLAAPESENLAGALPDKHALAPPADPPWQPPVHQFDMWDVSLAAGASAPFRANKRPAVWAFVLTNTANTSALVYLNPLPVGTGARVSPGGSVKLPTLDHADVCIQNTGSATLSGTLYAMDATSAMLFAHNNV